MASDRKVIAAEIAALKARVKAEMIRRNGYTTMVDYGGYTYDYVNPAQTDKPLVWEHMNNNYVPLKAVNAANLPESLRRIATESDMKAMELRVSAFESQPRNATANSDCGAACSGMCVTQCTTACGSACIGACTTGCTGCYGSCTGCYGSCTGCSGVCSGCTGCGDGCSAGCGGGCAGGCGSTCMGCSGCSGSSVGIWHG